MDFHLNAFWQQEHLEINRHKVVFDEFKCLCFPTVEEAFTKFDDATSLSTIDGKKTELVKEDHCKPGIHYISLSLSLSLYIYISYFNCEISSHLKLAIRWVDLNLLNLSLHALEIANQTSTTMKHKPLVWTSCAFGRPWEGKSSLDPVWSVGTRDVADSSEVKPCLLRSKCAIECEHFHAK